MKSYLLSSILVGISLTTQLHVGYAKTQVKNQKDLPKILQEIEDKYTKSKTLSAQFSQVTTTKTTSTKKINSGKIFVKRPSKIRWETTKPENNLLIGDGNKFWFYTPPFDEDEHGQVIEKKASQVQSRLAHALLSGSFSVARDMKIQEKSPSTFLLTPKAGSAGTVSQATIEVDPEKKLIQKVILDHKGGNHAEITLSEIQLGEDLKDDLFIFKSPPNTDVIDE